jgi:hypothetical protein
VLKECIVKNNVQLEDLEKSCEAANFAQIPN